MDSVQRQISSWMDKRPYSSIQQTNPERTRHSVVIRIRKRPDFNRWSLIIGDGFHNLRSALDHLVYAVAAHELEPAVLQAVVKKLSFPISDTENDFKSKSWHIAPLSVNVRTEIEALQPYKRPHPQMPPLLAVLRDFDDIDKHRLLQMAISQLAIGEFRNINAPIEAGETHTVIVHLAEIEDGTEIAALITPRPAANMRYNFKATIGISLPHAKGPLNNERSGIDYLFGTLRDEVNFVIKRIQAVVI